MRQISKKYNRLTSENAVKQYDAVLDAIVQVRTKIYEENSVDTFDESGNNTGYIIDISSLATLKRVYLLNTLERKLKITRDIRSKEILK